MAREGDATPNLFPVVIYLRCGVLRALAPRPRGVVAVLSVWPRPTTITITITITITTIIITTITITSLYHPTFLQSLCNSLSLSSSLFSFLTLSHTYAYTFIQSHHTQHFSTLLLHSTSLLYNDYTLHTTFLINTSSFHRRYRALTYASYRTHTS